MTVEEKRDIVTAYCGSADCETCKLANGGWTHVTGTKKCLDISRGTEEELDMAIAIMKGLRTAGMSIEAEPKAQLEQIVEDADTVIKIKSSRAIESVFICFREESGNA